MKYTMKINGMMCSHCTGRVQKALQNVQGVVYVQVDLQGAVVEAPQNASQALTQAVVDQGYEVMEVNCEG